MTVIHPRRLDNSPATHGFAWLARKGRQIAKLFLRPTPHWQPLDKRVRLRYTPDLESHSIPDGDAVVATFWKTAEYVIDYPPSKGQKFYLVQDFDPWLGPKERLEVTWRWPLKKIAVSRWLHERVLGAGASPDDTFRMTLGINHNSFQLLESIGARPKRVIMFYGLASYKAPEDGLRALGIAKRRHPDMEGVIFGPTHRRPEGIPPWLVYKGNVPEVELVQLYNSSRICVCCSLAEGFAAPPAEAMACGCAVASTDCGGIRDFAEHEVTSLLSPPGDPEALGANIVRLLNDDDLRRKLALTGYQHIRKFTWARSTDLLEECFVAHTIPK